jgi:hypothetical protein
LRAVLCHTVFHAPGDDLLVHYLAVGLVVVGDQDAKVAQISATGWGTLDACRLLL